MQRLGKVLTVTRKQRLIVKSRFAPPPGVPVYDKGGVKIGSVFDVFGSVKKPYVSVNLDKGVEGASLINREIFVSVRSRAKGRGGGG